MKKTLLNMEDILKETEETFRKYKRKQEKKGQ